MVLFGDKIEIIKTKINLCVLKKGSARKSSGLSCILRSPLVTWVYFSYSCSIRDIFLDVRGIQLVAGILLYTHEVGVRPKVKENETIRH